MRQAFIVTYDICDDKRLRRVYKLMRGYGRHVQLSVFQCELDPRERVELESRLRAQIKHDEDQVLFLDLGPVDGRGSISITALGRAYTPTARSAIVT